MKLGNPISLIPPQYKIAAYIVAFVLFVGILFGGGFWSGWTVAENKYTAIIATMEKDAAELRAANAELQTKLTEEIANVKERVITKYVDRVRVIKEKQYVYRDKATNAVPAQYELSNGWVHLHDAAATNTDADSTRSADGTTSGVKDNQALAIVADNYAACHANAEQLKSLQDYVREVQRVVAEANEILGNNKK